MTKVEKARIERMLPLGCVACAHLSIPNINQTEVHHLLYGNIRMGHLYSIPLCPQHHRGVGWDKLADVIPPALRVSIADGRKAFTAVYPPERVLWATVQQRLKLAVVWPGTKLVERRA